MEQITKIINVAPELTIEVVTELVGVHAMPIIDFLRGKTKISEFIIAEELDMEINATRNILYKLLEHNLVIFLRKKDKIKGWYICYWDFNEHMVPQLKKKIIEQKIEKLQDRLTEEQANQFYMCRGACSRMNFDKAMEFNFKCPECGDIMNEQDNARTIEVINTRIDELNKDL